MTVLNIPVGHPAFVGHFEGHPLLPGVALLAEVLEVLLQTPEFTAAVGCAPRLSSAKFLTPVLPDACIRIQLTPTPRAVKFEVYLQTPEGERPAATGQFERQLDALPIDRA
jgi:3-hydroxyacyl-[acyl-carrier-protein] dehydratase